MQVPDCVLLDYHMPEADPLAALRELQLRNPTLALSLEASAGPS